MHQSRDNVGLPHEEWTQVNLLVGFEIVTCTLVDAWPWCNWVMRVTWVSRCTVMWPLPTSVTRAVRDSCCPYVKCSSTGQRSNSFQINSFCIRSAAVKTNISTRGYSKWKTLLTKSGRKKTQTTFIIKALNFSRPNLKEKRQQITFNVQNEIKSSPKCVLPLTSQKGHSIWLAQHM